MRREIEKWSAKDLYKKRAFIQYPDFQREPTVWTPKKKQLLIDSMLIDLDIPKIYLYCPENDNKYCRTINGEKVYYYDCVDGQQRIMSVIEFFNGTLPLKDGRHWNDLGKKEKQDLLDYEFTIVMIREATDDELRLLFLRLQLGAPLNVGEKLHAMKGGMRDFVFDVGKNNPFFSKVSIPERRFAKETVFAQICINSFYRTLHDTFYGARYEDLKGFFEQYAHVEKYSELTSRIVTTLDMINEYFGDNACKLTNRAIIVTGYLFFEDLRKRDKQSLLSTFSEFYFKFLEKLAEQTGKGLDYDREYREILDFQSHVIQAAVGKSAIESRHKILRQYFEYYVKTGEIKKTRQ